MMTELVSIRVNVTLDLRFLITFYGDSHSLFSSILNYPTLSHKFICDGSVVSDVCPILR